MVRPAHLGLCHIKSHLNYLLFILLSLSLIGQKSYISNHKKTKLSQILYWYGHPLSARIFVFVLAIEPLTAVVQWDKTQTQTQKVSNWVSYLKNKSFAENLIPFFTQPTQFLFRLLTVWTTLRHEVKKKKNYEKRETGFIDVVDQLDKNPNIKSANLHSFVFDWGRCIQMFFCSYFNNFLSFLQ